VLNGIQDCGVDPIEWRAGRDLAIGDKVSVWWMPKGALLLEVLPYKSQLAHLFSDGAYMGRFSKVPSPAAPKPYCDMVVDRAASYPIMP